MGTSVDVHLPPGFRFHPTDDELVTHYLCRKCAAMPVPIDIVADIDLYKYDPWQLPGMALYGEKEWYFFSPRDRKYPNGSRPNRTAGSGYWKATGADKPIGTPKTVAIKKALVFYSGKAPKGVKTNWIMHEYRLACTDRSAAARRKDNSLRLDDWVLCRIYNKKGSASKQVWSKSTRSDKEPVIDTHVTAHEEIVQSSYSEHVLSPEFTCEREVQSQPRWNEWEKTLGVPINYGDATGIFSDLGPGSVEPGFRDPIQDILMFLQKPF